MIRKLKNPDILKEKPNLKLTPAHYHYVSKLRGWNAERKGQAITDEKGWYK
jgi:hypothetical protein